MKTYEAQSVQQGLNRKKLSTLQSPSYAPPIEPLVKKNSGSGFKTQADLASMLGESKERMYYTTVSTRKSTRTTEMRKYPALSPSLYHEKIICADGLLFRCGQGDLACVPEEMVNLKQLMVCLEREHNLLENNNNCSRHPVQTSPKAVPPRKRDSDCEGSLESRSGSFINRVTTYSTSPSKKRTWSNSTESAGPNSVLIKVTHEDEAEKETDNFNTLKDCNHRLPLREYEEQLKWLCEKGTEYVAMETFRTLPEVFAYLSIITKATGPLLIDVKLNSDKSTTLTYHFYKAFKQDYMMLKLGGEYCMFMAPF